MAKVGLSYSRCVRDIVDGTVDIRDVLVIVSGTDFDPHDADQWTGIWQGYGGGNCSVPRSRSHPEWAGYSKEDEDRFRSVSIELWESGKLHQPRKFGARPGRFRYYWLETFAPEVEVAKNPAVKKAWDNYKLLAGLS